jgi:hypothetical protein
MIHQKVNNHVILISQPSHAWLSGQLARAWGNDSFMTCEPFSEVCLAAEQHDIGWIDWEQNPEMNKKTGYPYNFLDMPFKSHLDIWRKGSRWAMMQNTYSALLISFHNQFLLNMHDFSDEPSGYMELAERFQKDEKQLQLRMIEELHNDPYYYAYVGEDRLDFNKKMIRVWDYFSLLLCTGLKSDEIIKDVPTGFDTVSTVNLQQYEGDKCKIRVNPWPFQSESLEVYCEAITVMESFTDESDMQARLKEHDKKRVKFSLFK